MMGVVDGEDVAVGVDSRGTRLGNVWVARGPMSARAGLLKSSTRGRRK